VVEWSYNTSLLTEADKLYGHHDCIIISFDQQGSANSFGIVERESGYCTMHKDRSETLFNGIAPIYGLFYHKQKRHFLKIVNGHVNRLNLKTNANILDVGCGTGALCAVLHKNGLVVTGIDTAKKMLQIASKNPEENDSVKRCSQFRSTPHMNQAAWGNRVRMDSSLR